MYMLQAGLVVLLVGDSTGLEFREVASKGAAQPFIIVYVRCVLLSRLMIRPPVQHVCTLVRLNFV